MPSTSSRPELQAPVRHYAQTTTSSREMSFGVVGPYPAGSMNQAARNTVGDEPSKELISSLKGYDHFALVVPPSLEIAGVDDSLRLGSTPAGSTQTS